MKIVKTLCSLAIICAPFVFKAQDKTGSTKDQVINEFVAKNYEFMDGLSEDGTYFLTRDATFGKVMHYFVNDLCVSSAIIPNDEETLNKFIAEYNTKYTLVSENTWSIQVKSDTNKASRVSVVWEDNGGYYILFYKEE
jgi:hypothetical protein